MERLRSLIASRNGKPLSSLLARACEKYLNAYENVSNWDPRYNGERRALQIVLSAVDGDVLDVGANEGQWATDAFPLLAGKRMHCFEPVPEVFAQLTANVGGLSGVTLVNAGLGAEPGEVTLHVDPGHTTISSAYPLIYPASGAQRQVCTIATGDAYLTEHSIETVSVLKIDVEGMEADCLRGFDTAFSQQRIAAVQFEHGPSHVHSGHTLKYFNDWFVERGFDVFSVFPHKLERLHYDAMRESFAGRNYVAVRSDLLGRIGL